MATVNEKMTAIADAIRDKTGGTEALSLDDMASGVGEVYEAGKKAKNEEYWRSFTENGLRKSYYSAFFRTDFSGESIPEGLCKPQRLNTSFAAMDRMFYMYRGTTLPKGIDASLIPEGDSVGTQMFNTSNYLTEIYDMGIPAVSSMASWFAYCNSLRTIEKIRVNENTTFSSAFVGTSSLENVTFEGVIGQNIDFKVSPLSVESLKNIIKHLKNYTGTSSESTYTLTVKASAWESLEAAGYDDEDRVWFYETFDLSPSLLEFAPWEDVVTGCLCWNLVLSN